ncbi:hypothetical protein SAMN05216389_106111 [Oceanobacillus limi]|uniref:Lipoprotein n=1 Tax=Oceanobacillus limi TaxID=930131 RepID=A0A1I0C9X2_9BACI|nr:hypothetical protein [Oceanobacillus limi]SET16231.1 hypothetical protein SAMN05216389_106111 [Oceanobacillus limi]
MKNIFIILGLIVSLLLGGCTSNTEPILKGTYQSDIQGSEYVVQMSFQPEDNSYVEYIENREVDKGTYEKENDVYIINSENQQNFQIRLGKEDTFEIIDRINNGEPIKLIKINDTPIYISTEFNDVENYKALLNKKRK